MEIKSLCNILDDVGTGASANTEELQKQKAEAIKEIGFRFNLANMFIINQMCHIANIKPDLDSKYARHNAKSYMDMKKKHIRTEAMQERLANQRKIVSALRGCDVEVVLNVSNAINRALRADGHRV